MRKLASPRRDIADRRLCRGRRTRPTPVSAMTQEIRGSISFLLCRTFPSRLRSSPRWLVRQASAARPNNQEAERQ
jgi:hypothetical protein